MKTARGMPVRRLVSLLTVLLWILSVRTPASPPSAGTFGRLPEIEYVSLSPSGSHYAALRRVRGKPFLVVHDLVAPAESATRVIELEVMEDFEETVDSIRWLNDETIGVVIGFVGNRLGTATYETRLITLSRDLSRGTTIPKPPRGAVFNTQYAHRILDDLPEDPGHVLMALDRSGRGTELSVYRVSVDTGEARKVLHGDEFVANYVADASGVVRLRHDVLDRKEQWFFRTTETADWKVLVEAPRGGLPFVPLRFTEDPNVLLALRTGEGARAELVEYQLVDRRFTRLVFAHEEVDVEGAFTDPYTRRILGAFYSVHAPEIRWFDEEMAAVQHRVDAALDRTRNLITGFDRHRRQFVVFASSAVEPGLYYLYHKESNELRPIGKVLGDLDRTLLRPAEPTTYTARDGLRIPGYLTLPAGTPPFPLVVFPHGGPAARDYQQYDYVAQFLATRGYAVLQPNFRGSVGYGVRFLEAGMKQWGLAMQDDLEDGTRAMIDRGIAAPDRICIVGWSYGGYAALMGAIRAPELFACAVAGAPVTDIPGLLKEKARFKFFTRNQPTVGHYRKDRDKLRDNSPINGADLIEIPVLLVHGDDDLVVPHRHSKRMAERLAKLGKPHRLVTLEGEGHHLKFEPHRIRFLEEVESWLGQYIGQARETRREALPA